MKSTSLEMITFLVKGSYNLYVSSKGALTTLLIKLFPLLLWHVCICYMPKHPQVLNHLSMSCPCQEQNLLIEFLCWTPIYLIYSYFYSLSFGWESLFFHRALCHLNNGHILPLRHSILVRSIASCKLLIGVIFPTRTYKISGGIFPPSI